jgi:putative phosphoesterase
MLIGVLSDTHSLLRPEVLDALKGVEHILHAGDVGEISILEALRSVAPTTAIRGNVDKRGAVAELPATEALELAGHAIYLVHALGDLDIEPAEAGFSVVIYGHSHQPSIAFENGVLLLNPGSCGPRRFKLPITLAYLHLEPGQPARAELFDLESGRELVPR